ncbi:glycerophosphodiester phosphodiesterase [Tannockella kyphosi]|uniref:glycerophosphodiester phosphodiesterase n=1 Tax=Tannockella kyphosi TaxID=2899121 RepID=UPI0020129A3D|nr:glycerophosphodiester phosphodiesterase [Tannockella kyphosi]
MKKKIGIGFLVIIMVYALLQVVPYGSGVETTPFKVEQGEAPLVIAHGGAKLLYPENTVYAFENVYDMGVDVLETDLCLTADGQLITHHNLTIDDYTNYSGYVNDYTYDELKEMNYGYNFESLDGEYVYRDTTDEELLAQLVPMEVQDMFTRYGTDVLYIMEIKDDGENGKIAADLLNEYIVTYGLQEYVCVASFDEETLAYFNEIKDPSIITSMDEPTAYDFIISNLVGYGFFMDFDAAGLQLPLEQSGIDLTNFYVMYKIHHNNMFVHYWTINDYDDMIMLIEKGADGIITDRPDLLFEALEEMGY